MVFAYALRALQEVVIDLREHPFAQDLPFDRANVDQVVRGLDEISVVRTDLSDSAAVESGKGEILPPVRCPESGGPELQLKIGPGHSPQNGEIGRDNPQALNQEVFVGLF